MPANASWPDRQRKAHSRVTPREIQDFLGRHYPHPDTLYLPGGSARRLPGRHHHTLDIDYTSTSAEHVQFQAAVETLAAEIRPEPEAVPIEELVPRPDDRTACHKFLGRFGALEVYSYDPDTIA